MANCKELHVIGSQAYKDCLEKNKEKDEEVVEVVEDEVIEDTDPNIERIALNEQVILSNESNAKVFGEDVFTHDLSLIDTKKLFDKIDTQEFKPEINLFGFFNKPFDETVGYNSLEKMDENDMNLPTFPLSLDMTPRQQAFVDRVASQDVRDIVLSNMANDKISKSLLDCRDGIQRCFDKIYDNIDNQGLRYLKGDQKRIAELNLELQKAVKSGDQDLVREVKKDLIKVRGKQNNNKSQIFDPEEGGKFKSVKYVDGELDPGDLSDTAIEIEENALTLIQKNRVENNGDVGVLQTQQTKLYYELISLSDIIVKNYDKVSKGKDKGVTQEAVEKWSNFFNGKNSLEAIKKMSETGILPKDLRLDYFSEGNGTILGDAFNEKIKEFLVSSRALLLNENPIDEEENVVLEGFNRKFKDFTGYNILNQNDDKVVFQTYNKLLGDVGVGFVDQIKQDQRLYTSIAELSYNTTLDLVPLITAMYGQNKIKGFKNIVNSVGKVGNYINKSFNPNNSKTISTVINTVFGLDGKGSSGIKEMIKLGSADTILETLVGQEPMPAEFGFILGSTNSLMEQKMVQGSLLRLANKIPAVKYIYGSQSGRKLVNTLIGAGGGTGAMTFTEAAQYALKEGIWGESEYNSFAEVFMSPNAMGENPTEPKLGKLLSLYVSFAAIGLGQSSTAKAIYADLKKIDRNSGNKQRIKTINDLSKGSVIEVDGKKAFSDIQIKDLNSEKNIQSATEKAIGNIKKDKNLTDVEKIKKIQEITEASEYLMVSREYGLVMDSFAKSETYSRTIEKESGKVIQKLTQGGNGLFSLEAKDIDFISGTDPIMLAKSLMKQNPNLSPRKAKYTAIDMQQKALFISNTATNFVGNQRTGEGGKLRNEIINVLKESQKIGEEIITLSKPENRKKNGIAGDLKIEKAKAKLEELKIKLQEQENNASDLAEARAIEKAAFFGDANVKVNILTGKDYKDKGYEPSEGVFIQKSGEIDININKIRETKSQNIVVHEVGHKIVLNQLKDLNGNLTSSGERILTQFKELIPQQQRKIVESALKRNYKNDSKSKQLEEFFTIFSEKFADGEIILPGETRKIEGINNASDLLNLVRRVQGELGLIYDGKTDKFSANLLEAIELGAKNAKVEGAQYKKIEFDPKTKLSLQINPLVTTETVVDFQKRDYFNISENIRNGSFDLLMPEGLNSKQREIIRERLSERLINYDPSKSALNTWLINNIEFSRKDANKRLYEESKGPDYLEENYKEAASVLDGQNTFEISGEAPALQRSTIKKILNLQPTEIDNVKRSIAKIVFGKESVQGLENLTRKDIQSIRQEFLKSETGDGTKIRKIVLNKINELGKNGLSTTSGVELVHSGISLSRMSNSLKGGGKGYDIFLEPVLKENGEQARYSVEEANKLGIALDKSGSGPLKYKKRPLSDFIKDGVPTQEYLNWIQGKDIASGARGRKNSLVNEITGELGMEAMLSTMVDQKIVIPPVLDVNGKVIEPARTEDLFPNATPEQKIKMATDAIVNFVGDKVSRVYKNTQNLLYSKKDFTKFNADIQGITGKDGLIDMTKFAEIFNKQGKDFQKLFNESLPGNDFVAYINSLNVKKIEEMLPLLETELKKGSPEYYAEVANVLKEQTNFKRYLNKIGVEYTPEKDLVKPEFNADGTKNSQNIVRTKGWMKSFIKQFGPWGELTKTQQNYILGTVGFGKNLRKELGLVKGDRTREQMLIDAFGKDVLTGERTVELPDVYQVAYNQTTKTKFEELIKDKDKYTPKELRDKMVKLLIPKGKGVEYFETMVANNTKAVNSTLEGFLNMYEKSSNKTRTFEDITNMLKLQTNHNSGIKGLFPITSILLEAKGSVNKKGEITNKKLHFEHNKELFNFSKSFLEILKSDRTLEAKKELIEKLSKDATQSIISEQMRFEKDADGRTVSGSLDADMATYGYREGAAGNAIDLLNPYGGTVAQKIQNKLKTKIVNNLIKLDTKGNKNIIMPKPENGLIFERNSKGEIIGSYSKKQHNLKLSKSLNDILFRTKGIDANLKVSRVQGKKEGASKGRFMNMFYGAEDFGGLTYSILAGKGKSGEADQAFFKDNLVTPYNRGVAKTEQYKITLKRDYANTLKQSKINDIVGKLPGKGDGLTKKIENSSFTYDQAVRSYLWNKSGYEIPGISKEQKTQLIETITNNPELQAFADSLLKITKNNKWTEPGAHWDVRNLSYDVLVNQVDRARKGYIGEFTNNVDAIFSEANLNKLEAAYGPAYRSSLESSIRRMKSGSNRPGGGTATENAFMNWTNNSIGAIMFFNRRSAVLQTLSSVNFINWGDNNPLKAAQAFGNIKQWTTDFTTIWNSDKLKARRAGLGSDLNSAEIAKAIKGSTNKPAAALSYLLKLGFTPTQLADSFAIASGGASMYRNRTNTYLKEGFELKEAEKKAWEDFSRISEETQQSADASLISQQQSSTLGRLVLAFQNTPMQYTRMISKSARDLANNRGDFKTNVSKIAYYGVVQNMAFASLQNALFSEINGFDGDDSDQPLTEEQQAKRNKKITRIVNNMFDSVARGYGIYGAIGSNAKNTVMKYMEEEGKDAFQKDHAKTLLEIINLSPPIGSKLRKIYNSIQTKEFNKDIIAERGFDVTYDGKVNLSPAYSVTGSLVEGVTNVPLERTITEINSLVEALDEKNSAFQRLALLMGWRTWDVGASNEEMDELRVDIKDRKKEEKKKAKEEEKEKLRKQEEERKYLGKTEEQIKTIKQRDSLVGTNKNSQIESLLKLGLTKKQIRELKLEKERVDKIIELTNK